MSADARDSLTLDLFAHLLADLGRSARDGAAPLGPALPEEEVKLPEFAHPSHGPVGDARLLFDELPTPTRLAPVRLLSVYVHFESRDDLADFARLIGQPVSSETSRIWYPADLAYSGALWDAPGKA